MDKSKCFLIDVTKDIQSLFTTIEMRFRKSVINTIDALQEGVGYISFNDESGFPQYYNVSLDEYEYIYAIRAVEVLGFKHLEIMTDRNFDENMINGWKSVYDCEVNFSEIFDVIYEQFNNE